MPSGRTHAAITALAAGLLAGASQSAGQPFDVTLYLAGGCLAGVLITPDLDVDEPVRSHSIVRRQAGMLPALAWRALWLPYSRLVPHRSWISHFPVVGTLVRVGYLALILWLVLALFGHPWPWPELPDSLGWAILGLGVSDLLHWAADLSNSRFKRLRRRALRPFW